MQYLGNKVLQVMMENGAKCWTLSPSQYIQNSVKNVETHLQKTGESPLPNKVWSPWLYKYSSPEGDVTPEILPTHVSYYQSLIGVLRWIVELGWCDICMETSAMASMMVMPREGHLKALLHMFLAFFKTKQIKMNDLWSLLNYCY